MSEYVCVTSKFGGLDGTYSHKTSPSHPPGWKKEEEEAELKT